jgi:hypothetical protein
MVKKTLLRKKEPSLPWLVLTSFVGIGIDHILELDQWNHVNALDVEEIMHQTKLHVIKLDKFGDFQQNWQKNFNFNAQSKK